MPELIYIFQGQAKIGRRCIMGVKGVMVSRLVRKECRKSNLRQWKRIKLSVKDAKFCRVSSSPP
jgi:hypothetical protein